MTVSKTSSSPLKKAEGSTGSASSRQTIIPIAPLIASVGAPSPIQFLLRKKAETLHPVRQKSHATHQWETIHAPHQFSVCRSPLNVPMQPAVSNCSSRIGHVLLTPPRFLGLAPCWIPEERAAYLKLNLRMCCIYGPSRNELPTFLYYRCAEVISFTAFKD